MRTETAAAVKIMTTVETANAEPISALRLSCQCASSTSEKKRSNSCSDLLLCKSALSHYISHAIFIGSLPELCWIENSIMAI